MKHFYTIILAAAAALSAVAQPVDGRLNARQLSEISRIKDPNAPQIIFDAPEGTLHSYSRSGGAYYAVMGNVTTQLFEGVVADFIEGTDGFWYLFNPFSQADTHSYLKLEKTDDHTLVARLPQAITQGKVDDKTITLYANRMNYTVTSAPGEEQEGTYLVDKANNTITFTLADGKWSMEGGQQIDTILGLADENDNWFGYGEFNTVFTPFTDKLVELPAGLTPEKWGMTNNGYDGHFINAAISGNDIYLQGVSTYFPQSWIKGTIDGTSISFDSHQYIGIEQAYTHYCFFNGADIVPVFNEYYQEYEDTYVTKEKATFTYDPTTRILTSGESDGLSVTTLGEKLILQVQTFANPTIRPIPADMSLTPANPIITLYEPYDPDYEFGGTEFTLPVTNTDGILLDKANIYYRIYLDNEPLTITPADYPSLTESYTLIPYNLDAGSDILVDGANHLFFFYEKDFERFGIQSVYIDGEAEHPSEIVYADAASVSAITPDAATVVSTVYYDLSGRPVANPASGLYIRRATLSDGTHSTTKVALP